MRPDLFLRLLAEETGERLFALDLTAALSFIGREPAATSKGPSTIAVVPLMGVLSANGVRYMGKQYTPGMNTFRDALDAAAANKDVGAIVIPTDSPGGTVRGTPETAAKVAEVAKIKPVVAYVDGMNASAAYWITSQASRVWAMPSADLGSIGVMGQHMEASAALAEGGLKATIIRSQNAPFKNEANFFEPLSEAALADMQAQADAYEGEMLATIAAGRKMKAEDVAAGFGQGRMKTAKDAQAAGMVDKIGTLSDLFASLHTQAGTLRKRMSARHSSLTFD
jgi:signal peptide peptidase SppA